ncbi:MAG: hypothetical protein GKR89_04435 [Candidatus Latescibacteria bacterium]|nr:hypothetical protein [Candidatus Latescibacterota bacterium]
MRQIERLLLGLLTLLVAVAISGAEQNPPAPGFDQQGSDAKAIEIADRVMERMGGRANWDGTRYLTWRFFGRRLHVWDKWTGRLRFEQGDLVVLMNVQDQSGRAWKGGEEIVQPDSLAAKLNAGYRAWINDSYWIAMPYKLKDSGVTLKYKGAGSTADGRAADILSLTFAGVGVTPQNKYEVFVDNEEGLVTQWAFYPKAADTEPRFVGPWANWQPYGAIWLSDARGERGHTDLAVFDELPESVFTSPQSVDMMKLAGRVDQ